MPDKSSSLLVAVPTFGRPESLQHLLKTLPSNCTPIVVHDGDDSSSFSRKTEAERNFGEALHLARRDKERFFANVTDSLSIPLRDKAKELLSFASQEGLGGNRNSILLFLAGRAFITMDDDTQYKFFSGLDGDARPGEVLLVAYSDKPESAMRFVRPHAGDPLNDLLSALEDQTDEGGPVIASMAGIVGGRWFSRPQAVLFASPSFHSQVYRNQRRYRQMRIDPAGVIQAPSTTTSRSGAFITACSAINAAVPVPPFPPKLRPEDAFWAETAMALIPGSGITYLPFSVFHDNEGKRPFRQSDLHSVGLDFALMSRLILHDLTRDLPVAPEKARFELLGERFVDTSHLRETDWREYCNSLLLQHVGIMVNNTEERIEQQRRKPRWWARDLELFIENAKRQAVYASDAEPDPTHRTYLRNYGELLVAWPQVWQAALNLNSSGNGLIQ